MRGIGAIAGLSSGGLIVGTLVPGAALVLLGVVYLLQGNTLAAPMNISHLLPQWTGIASLVLIVNNFLSYAGMEVNAVHVNDLRNPGKEYPKAMFLASALVVVIFVLPALRRGQLETERLELARPAARPADLPPRQAGPVPRLRERHEVRRHARGLKEDSI